MCGGACVCVVERVCVGAFVGVGGCVWERAGGGLRGLPLQGGFGGLPQKRQGGLGGAGQAPPRTVCSNQTTILI